MRPLKQVFRELFECLQKSDYQWTPVQPERLLEYRASSEAFPVLQRCFGLGVEVSAEELVAEGLDPGLVDEVLELRPAVSRSGDRWIAHAHWPAVSGQDYVYLGAESFELIKLMEPEVARFENAAVLDLGSGSGILSLVVGGSAAKVLGFDVSKKAVRWAQASALAQELTRVHFEAHAIGSPEAEALAGARTWDFAILNPPFAIPVESDSRPHRDGGNLGIELPLLFLKFAYRQLRAAGEVFTLVTNPIVGGNPAFFDSLGKEDWEIVAKKCLHDQFNHSLYRKERYHERGIQRVELWFLHLKKKARKR